MEYYLPSIILLCILFMCCDGSQRKNILFLVADDMRPELGCYLGEDFPSPVHSKMHTPNIDKLASRSLLLKRAYVQQAICSPSRTSLLTGRRPDTTHVYDLKNYFRNVGGNFTTIPEYFKFHGYESIGMGKIFHPGEASDHDDPISWSRPYYHANAKNKKYWDSHKFSYRSVPKSKYKDKLLPDMDIANHAIKVLKEISEKAKTGEKQFFVAVGFHKPHLPFVVPEEAINFYPEDTIKLPPNPYAPVGLPDIAWHIYKSLLNYEDIKKHHFSGKMNTTLPDDIVKALRKHYYAAITYTDGLIGQVIQELERQGLSNNTIISLWGDHGYQLGEHGEWAKQTNFELATHAPMMIHIPGVTDRGIITEKLTEFVDLFPTLVEAAGLPNLPVCPPNSTNVQLCSEGTSLMPLMKDPATSDWKSRVFSQFPREGSMGYTMRTDQYRYTEWVHFSGPPHYKPDWNISHGTELYDHKRDPAENWNRADDSSYKMVRKMLSQQLHDGWRAALPNHRPHLYENQL